MEAGIVLLFAAGAFWMWLTTPEQRQMIFGYMMMFGVIMYIFALITGIGPGSAYDYGAY